MGKKLLQIIKWLTSLSLVVLFVFLFVKVFTFEDLRQTILALFSHPILLVLMVVGYTIAFLLRAWCWRILVNPNVPFVVYLSGIFYSLFFNHLLPFKGGEAVRVGALAQHQDIKWTKSLSSVVSLRALDLLWLGLFAMFGASAIGIQLNSVFFLSALVAIGVGTVFLYLLEKHNKLPAFVSTQWNDFTSLVKSRSGLVIISLSGISWIFEGIVVYAVAIVDMASFSYLNAMWVTALSVGSGVLQLAPGGLATYESVMSLSLYRSGFQLEDAFMIAIITHGFKYLYSFAAGAAAFYMYPLKMNKLKSFVKSKGETE
ncbi:lysylphosphatidylglycerol synthase transmembrane domain-containing protein [Alkalihalobacillus sp. CinArs1]|uniref:lysylphosphatidylglycerol synthase transmembrane domain-containing protein n=1 Tax=Alkalihalobacillus sp. CinArs1 TaxID=2995314 RepID=UPI0022DD8568|nr:lysylphosphatidylglycerol synthase transmembrane domain-containing protein [Alkalihalobacillus sp. CinArs1]